MTLSPSLRRAAASAAVLAAAASAPAHAQVPPLVNSYNLWATSPPEAWLRSYVDCGLLRCDIAYSVSSYPVDRNVELVWKDVGGAPLVSADNASLDNYFNPIDFGGYLQALEWRKGATGSALMPTPPTPLTLPGTADFTGTSPGPDPCGIGYVCANAMYYDWPSPWGGTPGTPGGPGGNAQRGAATEDEPVLLARLGGTLSNVGFDPTDPASTAGPRVEFLSFESAVEADGDGYLYRYTARNLTDRVVPFDWAGAGMEGELQPFATAEWLVASDLAPTVRDGIVGWTLSSEGPFPIVAQYTFALEVLVPVPEPAAWAQLASGLALLGSVARIWRRRRAQE